MCASCGCGKFEESHGDERNLTLTDLKDAAEAGGVSLQDVAKNIQAAAGQQSDGQREQQTASAGGQNQQ